MEFQGAEAGPMAQEQPAAGYAYCRSASEPENVFLNTDELRTLRIEEAGRIIQFQLREDVDSLFTLIIPSEPITVAVTDGIIEDTMAAIEGIPITQRPEVPYPRFSMGQLALYRHRYDEARALDSIRCLHFLNDDVCVDLREREMYPRIADMVMFVSQRIKTAMDDRRRAGEEIPANANILLPNGKWDIKPLGADDDHRIDGALAPYELSSPVRPKG
ncbi:hypothetical protein EV175_005733, partial [Coemansia sp. RSA 1933]